MSTESRSEATRNGRRNLLDDEKHLYLHPPCWLHNCLPFQNSTKCDFPWRQTKSCLSWILQESTGALPQRGSLSWRLPGSFFMPGVGEPIFLLLRGFKEYWCGSGYHGGVCSKCRLIWRSELCRMGVSWRSAVAKVLQGFWGRHYVCIVTGGYSLPQGRDGWVGSP